MPAQKKPAEKLQRRNKLKELDAQVVELNSKSPAPPKGLSKELTEEWRSLWQQQVTATYAEEHMPMIKRLFRLKSQEEVLDAEGMLQPLSYGSKDQKQINPLLKHAKELRAEILNLEDRLGLNPLAAMKLGIAVGEAQRSLDDMNKRIVAGVSGGDANERPDPRLANIIDVGPTG